MHQTWFHRLLHKFRWRRASRPEDIPRKLDSETLARALNEAQFLRGQHRVDVATPAPGELPLPRRADDGDH